MPVTLAKIGHCAEMHVRGRRGKLLPFQILRRGDAAAFARDDGRGGLVKDDEYGLDRRVGIGIAELDQAVDVGDAHVVAAGREPVHGFQRAVGSVDGHVEAFGLKVALLDGKEEWRRRPVDFAVEREADRGLGVGR